MAMNIRLLFSTALVIGLLGVSFGSQADWWPFNDKKDSSDALGEPLSLGWGDLIPDDYEQPENPFETMSQEEIDKLLDGSDESNLELARLEDTFNYAPVNDNLDGKRVRIPAYVTPLDFDGNLRLKEFLLVPYLGACIHTPPPPANQVVFGEVPEAIELDNLYEPVWATGVIRAETVTSALAETGYRLEIETVTPYTQPAQ